MFLLVDDDPYFLTGAGEVLDHSGRFRGIAWKTPQTGNTPVFPFHRTLASPSWKQI